MKKILSIVGAIALTLNSFAEDLRIQVQVYSVDKEKYPETHAELEALLAAGEADLIMESEVVTRSGQRASAKTEKEVIYVADAGTGGLSLETRNTGSYFEVEAALGGDNYTIDLNYSIQNTTAAPQSEWRSIDVGGALKAEDPKFATRSLVSSSTLYKNAQWSLVGKMPDSVTETGEVSKKVYPVFMQVKGDEP